MGAFCCSSPSRANAQLLEQQPRSDKQVVLDVPLEPRSEAQPVLDASQQPRSDEQPALDSDDVRSAGSAEGSQRRTAEQLQAMAFIDRRDTDQPDPDVDPSTLPYRIFLRGAMIGCALMAMPMAVLIWIVISNGILYRFYPLPDNETS